MLIVTAWFASLTASLLSAPVRGFSLVSCPILDASADDPARRLVTPAQDLIASLDGRLARQPKVQQQAVCPPAHPKKDEPLKILYAGPQKYFSTRPLAQLKRIEIRSLSLRKRHEGRYLLVRVVSRLCKVVGISFVWYVRHAHRTRTWGAVTSLPGLPVS